MISNSKLYLIRRLHRKLNCLKFCYPTSNLRHLPPRTIVVKCRYIYNNKTIVCFYISCTPIFPPYRTLYYWHCCPKNPKKKGRPKPFFYFHKPAVNNSVSDRSS